MTDPNTTPAGWYDDGTGALRYWDGNAWTEHRAPAGSGGPPQNDSASTPAAASAPVESTPPDSAATQTYGLATATAARPNDVSALPEGSTGAKPHVLGIIALAVAVIGFIFACIPGALIVGWVLLPIAFILAIVAFFLRGKKWPAIAALVLSVVGTIVGFLVFFTVVTTSFDDAFGQVEGTTGQASESAGDTSADSDEPAPVPVKSSVL